MAARRKREAKPASRRSQPLRPVDIPLRERTLLDDGRSMLVTLRSVAELDAFFEAHRTQFPYACFAVTGEPDNPLLNPYQWIFGVSKEAVVRAVLRWGESAVDCIFYDWAADEPKDHASFFAHRDGYRAERMSEGAWTPEDEVEYQADCARRTPATYRGWWTFINFPLGDAFINTYAELFDSTIAHATAAAQLQELLFDEWRLDPNDRLPVRTIDSAGIDRLLYGPDAARSGLDHLAASVMAPLDTGAPSFDQDPLSPPQQPIVHGQRHDDT